MDGRPPEGIDAKTRALFPNGFEKSEVGDVPVGWRSAPLADWVMALSGGTPAKDDKSLWGGDIPWISPKVMMSIHADEADDFVTPRAIGNGTRLAPAGSTLVMVRGMGLHQEVRVSQARAPVTFNQDVKALVPKGIESSLLLFALLNGQAALLSRVESSGHGTGRLPSDLLLAHRIAMPSDVSQRALAVHFDAINDRIASARAESRTLAELRDHLLPKLMSGELRVGAAE
jgi:type I restriction enzyme S subunit